MKEIFKHAGILILAAAIGHFIAYKMVHIPQRLELVIITALLLFYPVLRRPLVGLYAVFIVSPFIAYIRRLYYLKYERPSLDPLIVLGDLFLVFILLGLFFVFRERRGEEHDPTGIIRIVFIYFVYLLIRTFFFNYLPVSEAVAKFKFYGPPVLFFFIGTVFYDATDHLKRFWYITIIIGVIASLYGYYQLYNGYSKAEMLWLSSIEFTTLFIKGVPRPFSFFQAPVVLADYVQLAVIGVLICFVWVKNRKIPLLLVVIPILLYASLITSVRSCWIGLIVTCFIWLVFFRIQGNNRRFITLLAILIAYIAYQYIAETFQTGFSYETTTTSAVPSPLSNQKYFDLLVANRAAALSNPFEEYSFLSRLNLWRDLLIFSKEPINAFLGRGLGTLKADSLYFTYLAEFGYPGIVFIIGIILAFIIKGFSVIDNSRDPDIVALAKGITLMNIVFAIVSITGTHIHYFPGDIYFWFWNGVILQHAVLARPEISDIVPAKDVQQETETS